MVELLSLVNTVMNSGFHYEAGKILTDRLLVS